MKVKRLWPAICILVASALESHQISDCQEPHLALIQVAARFLGDRPDNSPGEESRRSTLGSEQGYTSQVSATAKAQVLPVSEVNDGRNLPAVLLQAELGASSGSGVLFVVVLALCIPVVGFLVCWALATAIFTATSTGLPSALEAEARAAARPDWAAPVPPAAAPSKAARPAGTQSPGGHSNMSSGSSHSLSGRDGSLPADFSGPLCPTLKFNEGRIICFSGDLLPKPQDVVLNIQDSTGEQLARAYAHETGLTDPAGIVVEAEGFGYFAFLDTSSCGDNIPEAQRRILVRRATSVSVSGAVRAVMACSSVNGGRVLVARAPTGEVLMRVQVDMLGRVVEVRDGQTRPVAQSVDSRPPTQEKLDSSSARDLTASRAMSSLQVTAGADVGLLLCAVLGAQKLR